MLKKYWKKTPSPVLLETDKDRPTTPENFSLTSRQWHWYDDRQCQSTNSVLSTSNSRFACHTLFSLGPDDFCRIPHQLLYFLWTMTMFNSCFSLSMYRHRQSTAWTTFLVLYHYHSHYRPIVSLNTTETMSIVQMSLI
jgi:hypothetical protein